MKARNLVTVKEVQEVIRELGDVLGLLEEKQEGSLNSFVKHFSNMKLKEASLVVLNAILIEDYVESTAQEKLKTIIQHFPNRTEENVKYKLMRVESILVAVAITIFIKRSSEEYSDWLYETAANCIEDNDILYGFERLETIFRYLERE